MELPQEKEGKIRKYIYGYKYKYKINSNRQAYNKTDNRQADMKKRSHDVWLRTKKKLY